MHCYQVIETGLHLAELGGGLLFHPLGFLYGALSKRQEGAVDNDPGPPQAILSFYLFPSSLSFI